MSSINISYKTYQNNIKLIKEYIKDTKLCVVVKGDAYGHNLEKLMDYIKDCELIDYYGICDNEEAKIIRKYSNKPIIRLRVASIKEIEDGTIFDIEEICGSMEMVRYFKQKPIKIHLAIDTGMNNMGLTCDKLSEISLNDLNIKGCMTHFKHLEKANTMLNSFLQAISIINCKNIIIHAFNSEKTLISDYFFDMIRVGLLTYGLIQNEMIPCKPILSWETTVIQIRKLKKGDTVGYLSTFVAENNMVIAVLPVGFYNGYLREFSNKSFVLVQGIRCKVVGIISMNVMTIDVTHIENIVRINDRVILVGDQGNQSITLEELSALINTVPTELSCLFGKMNNLSISNNDECYSNVSI